ncbi:transcription elongation factor GreA [Lutibacter sp. B2]|nr:transcription elongation factor GreA [Lutibacter sp. B2]
MSNKEVLLTQAGYNKTEEELDNLKSVKRREVSARIKEAIAFGDLSENSEYDEAKNEQAKLEEKIAKLEEILRKATIINEEDISLDVVNIGSKVEVDDKEFNEIVEYTIVGSAEADPYDLKISNESPVGKALLGHQVGEIVEVQVPDGIIKYEILNIRR